MRRGLVPRHYISIFKSCIGLFFITLTAAAVLLLLLVVLQVIFIGLQAILILITVGFYALKVASKTPLIRITLT